LLILAQDLHKIIRRDKTDILESYRSFVFPLQLGSFLSFLARDIERNPQRIEAIGRDLAERVNSFAGNAEVDLDAPLPGCSVELTEGEAER
jgi:prlF antitoxin for toxin YhaV_toxin